MQHNDLHIVLKVIAVLAIVIVAAILFSKWESRYATKSSERMMKKQEKLNKKLKNSRTP